MVQKYLPYSGNIPFTVEIELVFCYQQGFDILERDDFLQISVLLFEIVGLIVPDKQFVESMVEIFGLLKIEASALATFAATNNPADVEKYDQARKQAWPKIKALLGIK